MKFQLYLTPASAGRFFMRENADTIEGNSQQPTLRKAQPNAQLPITNYQLPISRFDFSIDLCHN
ncbi:MAG: hypothetical protein ACRC62_25555 [Microcoleus sp.]